MTPHPEWHGALHEFSRLRVVLLSLGMGAILFVVAVMLWSEATGLHFVLERPKPDLSWPYSLPAANRTTSLVPGSSVGDVMKLPRAGRERFYRGYFATIAAYRDYNYMCAVPWFYKEGGYREVESYFRMLDPAVNTTARPRDIDYYKRVSMVEVLSQFAYDACARKGPPPPGGLVPSTPGGQ